MRYRAGVACYETNSTGKKVDGRQVVDVELACRMKKSRAAVNDAAVAALGANKHKSGGKPTALVSSVS